jgi:hypothetical protein
MVRMIVEEQGPNMIAALRGASPRWRAILFFSLKFFLVQGVILGVLALMEDSPLTADRFQQFFLSPTLVFLFALVSYGCLAWLLMPAAIRLLQSSGGSTISAKDRKLGVAFVVATSAASSALGYCVGKAEAGIFFKNQWEIQAAEAVSTLVINAPQVLLFIFLALLASPAADGEPARIRDWAQPLFSGFAAKIRRAREWHSRSCQEDLDALMNRGDADVEPAAESVLAAKTEPGDLEETRGPMAPAPSGLAAKISQTYERYVRTRQEDLDALINRGESDPEPEAESPSTNSPPRL